jgi:hypothetical protein
MSNKTRGLRAGSRSASAISPQNILFVVQPFPFPEFSDSIFIMVRKTLLVHITKGE